MKYWKNNLSIHLLIVAMLISVFAFTGYNANSNVFNNPQFQVELVSSEKATPKKNTIGFKKVIPPSHINICIKFFSGRPATLFITYNKLIKAKFDHISKVYQSIKAPARFLQLKNIRPNLSDHAFTSIG